MGTKSKTLLGALVVLMILCVFYFGAGALKKKAMQGGYSGSFQEEQILTNFDLSQIVKIEVLSSGLVLEKINNIWRLALPSMNGITIDQGVVFGHLWSIANLHAEQIIEEAADDLSQYGLDAPSIHTAITDSAGKRVELFFGNLAPGRDAIYVMRKDDPKIYTVLGWAVASFGITLNDVRNRDLLPNFDPDSLSHFILEKDGIKIEIVPIGAVNQIVPSLSSYAVISPYQVPRGAEIGKFAEIRQSVESITTINEFIDDAPLSLAPYGLDKPGRLYIESPNHSLDLRFGTGEDGTLYAKLADSPGVFTLFNLEKIIDTEAFYIIDQFILIFNINKVKDFTVKGEGRNFFAAIQETNGNQEFYLNGKKAEDASFRTYYESVIRLFVEAEYPSSQSRTSNGNNVAEGAGITVTYNLREPAGSSFSVSLVPYNRDFYSLNQGGATEFLVSRAQVRRIFDAADKVVYE
jgi:hypothetical protein